jgi:hypothetical protein
MPIIHEGRQLLASPEEPACAKMTILEGGFETRLGLARKERQNAPAATGEANVKARYPNQTPPTP